MSTHSFPSKDSTRQWIRSFSRELKRPCVVLLSGDLGSGKTQFVRWFLEELGVEAVTSPTFAIHNEYPTSLGPIDHVDLYRVRSDQDLESSGFWDLLADSDRLVFVEWADRLPVEVWPSQFKRIEIRLKKNSDGSEAREMELSVKTP
jgi:tRNA threonylcarbamoyladenosine biosynthesis protein TsaE